MDDDFEISFTKTGNIEILYFDKINPKIFVAAVCNYAYLYKIIGFIIFGEVLRPNDDFIKMECEQLGIEPDTKLCLNNGVL